MTRETWVDHEVEDCWGAAAQVYPKLFLIGGSMYDTAWWRWLVAIWEALVYNPLIDLGACYQARARPYSQLPMQYMRSVCCLMVNEAAKSVAWQTAQHGACGNCGGCQPRFCSPTHEVTRSRPGLL